MKTKFVIEFGAKEIGVALACALVFGGGFAAVQSYTGEAQENGLPMVLPYQGTLSKAGAPFTGTQAMRFKLYSDASGTAFWTSDPRSVDVVGGKFAVTLGDANDANKLEAQDFRHSELYVELVVDGTTLSPMQRIAPAPQAITAAQASGDFTIPGELGVAAEAHVQGAVGVDGDLDVKGQVQLGDAPTDGTTIAGSASVGAELDVTGKTTLEGDVVVSGQAVAEQDLTVEGRVLLERSDTIPVPTNGTANFIPVPVSGALCGLAPEQPDGVFSATDASTNQTYTGLEAARFLCQTTCGSQTAHMCTAHEINISAQFGIVPSEDAWFSSFVYSWNQTAGGTNSWVSDCNGWGSRSNYRRGLVFGPGQDYAFFQGCNESARIACCD